MKTCALIAILGCALDHTEGFFVTPASVGAIGVHSTRTESYEGHTCASSAVSRRPPCAGLYMATSSELDQSAEYVKAELARVQEEYEAKRKAKMQEQTRQAAARGDAAVTPLSELELIPYLDKEGMVSKVDTTGVKASVYAVYDESKTLQYIGVSRGVQQSLRLHLARRPKDTYYFKVQNIARPSRSLLEVVKDSWMEENGSTPAGNDEGDCQATWENPLNVVPLFTEEDKAFVAEKKEKGREATGIKTIARRFEGEIVKILEGRGAQESMRFDPKLKGNGLLDLYMEKPKPDTSVPK